VKRIREILAQKGITAFDRLRDQQVLNNIYVNTDGEVFVNYSLGRTVVIEPKAPRNKSGEKILAKLEKNLAALRNVLS